MEEDRPGSYMDRGFLIMIPSPSFSIIFSLINCKCFIVSLFILDPSTYLSQKKERKKKKEEKKEKKKIEKEKKREKDIMKGWKGSILLINNSYLFSNSIPSTNFGVGESKTTALIIIINFIIFIIITC